MNGHRWQERALCRETGPEAFALDFYAGDALIEAKAICGRCPVTAACLKAALAEEAGQHYSMRDTVRGGLTPRERAAIDKQRRQAA